MKTADQLQEQLTNVHQSIMDAIKGQLERIKGVLHKEEPEADFDGFIDLPSGIVYMDMEDGNLIELIERIHTNGLICEAVLHGDGREIELEELASHQLIGIVRQLEKITEAKQIEVA